MPHPQKSKARLLIICTISLICLLTIPGDIHVRASSNSSDQVQNSDVQPLTTNELIWERTYGGAGDDRAFCMTPTDDGGFLIGGSSTSFNINKTAAWVVKINGNGNTVWNKTYCENDGSEFRSIQKTADGFLLVGNTFLSSGMEDAWIVKIDNEGNVAWNKTIGGENFNKVFSATIAADGFVLAGLTNSSNNGNSDGWLLKTDMKGNLIWNKTYAEVGDSAFRAILVSTTGDYVAAGYSASAGNGNYGLWLVKTDSNGTVMWNQAFSGVESDKAYALVASRDGYVMVGETHANQEANADAFAAKTDLNGKLIWKKTYGGADFDVASTVTTTRDGGYLVVGFTFSYGKGQRDFWFFEIDDLGNVAWSRTCGGEGYEEAYAAVEVGDNEFIISGWTNSIGAGSYDFYVIRTRIVTTANGFDLGIFGYVVLALLGTVIIVLFGYLCARLYRDAGKARKRDSDSRKMENR